MAPNKEDHELTTPVELVVLSVKGGRAQCRVAGGDRAVTLRLGGLQRVVPGELVTVAPRQQRRQAGRLHLSGDLVATRLEAAALGLVPLRLVERGSWSPEDWEHGDEDWEQAIAASGPRPVHEMERPVLGQGSADQDLVLEAIARIEAGDAAGARQALMDLLEADLLCLDAHALLGLMALEPAPEQALRHYAVAVALGELSLGPGYLGVLPWEHRGNRTFLRSLKGHGLSLWRLERLDEAARAFERLLALDPSDPLKVRDMLRAVRAGELLDAGG